MTRYNWWLRWWLRWWLTWALPVGAWAQVPAGNGLHGEYYQGTNFEQPVATRRDATIDFDWHERRPVAGVAAEQFSARWTGWLVPPTTGRYVLHLSADDGVRLWLNDRPLLDDWRNQGLNFYQLAVDLTAGQAYALRLDYCQYVGPTRVQLAWEVPVAPVAAGPRRHRKSPVPGSDGAVVVPTRYLFREAPALPPVLPPAQAAPPAPPGPVAVAAAPTSLVVVQPDAAAATKPRPRSYLAVAAGRLPVPPAPVRADSSRVATAAARLAAGRSVTLRALYFEQGQANLLPAVQASLDTLAGALASRPALRLEVQGHTDNQGDPAVNQRLSQRRAVAVCAYLASHGVAASRLRAVGYGGSRPVADNRQPDQRALNRRVVLKPLGH